MLKKAFPNLDVIAGNIATAEAAKHLAKAGVDGVKVGIGPGTVLLAPSETNATVEASKSDLLIILERD